MDAAPPEKKRLTVVIIMNKRAEKASRSKLGRCASLFERSRICKHVLYTNTIKNMPAICIVIERTVKTDAGNENGGRALTVSK